MTVAHTLRAEMVNALRALIESDFREGDRLPPEVEIAKRMNVSRNTIREAIGELVSEGRLDRRWGVGTTVLRPTQPAIFSLSDLSPIRRVIEASGHAASLARFHAVKAAADVHVADQLLIAGGARVWLIERLFAVDGTPAVLLKDWCPTSIGGRRIDVSSLADVTVDLPSLIQEQAGVRLHRMDGRVDAVTASSDFKKSNSAASPPLIQISQHVATASGDRMVYSIIQFDTSVIELTIHRQFPSPSN